MVRLENLLKVSLQDVLKMPWRNLEDVFKTSWTHLENVLNTSWRRLEDIWPRRIYWPWPRRLEGVLKTSSEDARLRRTFSSWSRPLEDVFWRRRRKTSSRRLHQDECLLGLHKKRSFPLRISSFFVQWTIFVIQNKNIS